jgi:hypothetical protein
MRKKGKDGGLVRGVELGPTSCDFGPQSSQPGTVESRDASLRPATLGVSVRESFSPAVWIEFSCTSPTPWVMARSLSLNEREQTWGFVMYACDTATARSLETKKEHRLLMRIKGVVIGSHPKVEGGDGGAGPGREGCSQ